MLEEEASTSIEELEVDLPPPPPPSSSLPSSPAATLPSPNAEIETQPLSSAPPLDSLASSSHLLGLPLLPEPLLGEQLHATESSSLESGEAEEGSAIEVSTRGEQQNQVHHASSTPSSPLKFKAHHPFPLPSPSLRLLSAVQSAVELIILISASQRIPPRARTRPSTCRQPRFRLDLRRISCRSSRGRAHQREWKRA
ncbi:hypothetical protein BDY24DRAFT_83850 [Mrakia frigida]|uniref:uncharacterized protein n=1 Tax=Mrakia frigida TaxID=29902 RepID=UPI003FCBF376